MRTGTKVRIVATIIGALAFVAYVAHYLEKVI